MDPIREKLTRCFAAVFPQLSPQEIAVANADNTPGWDSMAQVTLLSVIGEEFEMDVDFEQFEGATSFEAMAERLTEINAGA